MTPEAADLAAQGAQLQRLWGQFKPGTGMMGTDCSPQHRLPPVLCAGPVPLPLPHHLLRGTLRGQQQFIRLLRGVSAARGLWEGGYGS